MPQSKSFPLPNQNNNFKYFLGIANYETSIKIEAMELLNFSSHKQVCYDVTKEEIYFLNDNLLLTKLEEISKLILNRFKDHRFFVVLDLNPFPILGLLLAQHGAKVYCRIEQENSEDIRLELCRSNNINEQNINFIPKKFFNDYTNEKFEFDVVIQNVITPSGLISETEMLQAQVMRYSLGKDGVYLPQTVSVWAQLVHCEWLNQATRVDDKNVCGFKIAQFINEYKVRFLKLIIFISRVVFN